MGLVNNAEYNSAIKLHGIANAASSRMLYKHGLIGVFALKGQFTEAQGIALGYKNAAKGSRPERAA